MVWKPVFVMQATRMLRRSDCDARLLATAMLTLLMCLEREIAEPRARHLLKPAYRLAVGRRRAGSRRSRHRADP
jgi:hypothetical protein